MVKTKKFNPLPILIPLFFIGLFIFVNGYRVYEPDPESACFVSTEACLCFGVRREFSEITDGVEQKLVNCEGPEICIPFFEQQGDCFR